MITLPSGIEIVNKDAVICNVTDKNTTLEMDIFVGVGNGYVTSEYNKKNLPQHDKIIGIDSVFSPIKRVAYNVETYYSSNHDNEQERLTITVETNGAISPDTAMSVSAKILQDQMQPFIGSDINLVQKPDVQKELTFDPRLLIRVENLELSVRSQNCLKNENIIYVGDLITKSELEMLRTPNFGRKSLSEIKEVLAKMDMAFGMNASEWPPEGNIEELVRKYEEKTSA